MLGITMVFYFLTESINESCSYIFIIADYWTIIHRYLWVIISFDKIIIKEIASQK